MNLSERNYTIMLKTIRYLISGGSAAVVNLAFLHLFVEYFGIWHILSSIFAFLIAFCVSFTLQKFWTFADKNTDKLAHQTRIYFIVSAINLGINTMLIYLFVDIVHLHYLLGQFIASGLLAISSYFIYSGFIFKSQNTDDLQRFDDVLKGTL